MFEPIEIKRSSRFGCNYWESHSPKLNRNVKLFTDLEYDHWILIETNSNILTFCESPKDINFFVNNQKSEKIFDMWIKQKNHEQAFISVFYDSELDENDKFYEKTMEIINLQKDWCNSNKFIYNVVSESDIRGNYILLKNMKKILSNIRVNRTQNKYDNSQILTLLCKEKLSIKNIKDELKYIPIERVATAICWLKYLGEIDGDFDKTVLNINTEVWKNDKT